MKKSICILLALILSAVLLVSCQGNSNPAESSTETDTSDETSGDEVSEDTNSLVKEDFNGATVKIFSMWLTDTEGSQIMDNSEIASYNSVLNASLNARREAVEQDYNVTFDEYHVIDSSRRNGTFLSTVRNMVTSGTFEYDILYPSLYDCSTLAREGYLTDLSQAEGISITNSWWSQPFIADTSICGTYYILGDIGINAKQATSCVLFNKKIFDDNGMEYPYELVKNHQWTISKMYEIVKEIGMSEDLNGDGVINYDDKFGVGGQYGNLIKYLHGANGYTCLLGDDGYPYLSLYTESNVKALTAAIEMMQDQQYYVLADDYFGVVSSPLSLIVDAFRSDRCVFYASAISDTMNLGDMESDFGIVPFPLGDETQESYHSLLGTWTVNAYCVVATMPSDQIYRACVLLDALGSYAVDTVATTYYDVVLQYQKLRSDDDIEMLKLIFDGFATDLGCIYSIAGLEGTVQSLVKNGAGSITSSYESVESAANAAIQSLIEDFQAFAG